MLNAITSRVSIVICCTLLLSLSTVSCENNAPEKDSKLLVDYPPQHDISAVTDAVEGNVRGYLTTPQELREIKRKADAGIEPYRSAVADVVSFAKKEWEWQPPKGEQTCPSADDPVYLEMGSQLAYAQALAYHLTSDAAFATHAISGIRGILGISGFGEPGNTSKPDKQCQLNLSWWIPGFIHAADLLEDVPEWQNSSLKKPFQEWLANVVYPMISFTAEVSMSNWGAAATHCCAAIADYLHDRNDLNLVSYNRLSAPEPFTARAPAEAFEHANALALGRMNGTRWEGKGGSSSACDFDPSAKSMIRPDGAIPDELRRGSTGCEGAAIEENDKSNMYSQTHLQQLIAHAELLLRRGDHRIYDNIQPEALRIEYYDPNGNPLAVELPAGRGSLLKAIEFVFQKSKNPVPRSLKSAGEVAYRYYKAPFILSAIEASRPNSSNRAMAFETLTHGFAEGETIALPPTVPAPK